MRTFLQKPLKTKFFRGVLSLTALAAIAACIAMGGGPDGRIKLGGTWVGRLGDITWTGTYAPDPSGQNAVITLQWMTLNSDFQRLNAMLGAKTPSQVSGCIGMTGPNTARGKLIWYLVDPGTASVSAPVAGTVKGIAVMTLDWVFTSKATALGAHELKVYVPNQNGSLLPEDGTLVPGFPVTFTDTPHQKIL